MATRKIIDVKQNGEKVWLKGHAQAIYMSDGSTVEDAINSIEIPSLDDYVTNLKTINNESLVGDGNIVVGNIISEEDDSLTIDDVDTNTYVKYVAQTLTDEQKAQVRTNINALSQNNIKTINGESIIGSGNIEIENGIYIWEWDGSESGTTTQDQWDALQRSDNILISNSGAIMTPQMVMKTESRIVMYLIATNGLTEWNLMSIIISSDLSYQTLIQEATYIKSGALKTINGESLEGSGDIVIGGGEVIQINDTNVILSNIEPEKVYVCRMGAQSLTIQSFSDNGSKHQEYTIVFYGGLSGNISLILPEGVLWANGEIPEIENGVYYELSITRTIHGNSANAYYKAVLVPFKSI